MNPSFKDNLDCFIGLGPVINIKNMEGIVPELLIKFKLFFIILDL